MSFSRNISPLDIQEDHYLVIIFLSIAGNLTNQGTMPGDVLLILLNNHLELEDPGLMEGCVFLTCKVLMAMFQAICAGENFR